MFAFIGWTPNEARDNVSGLVMMDSSAIGDDPSSSSVSVAVLEEY